MRSDCSLAPHFRHASRAWLSDRANRVEMIRRRRSFHRNAANVLPFAASACVLLGCGSALAQDSRPIVDAPAAVQAPTAPAPANKSGCIDAMCLWLVGRGAKLETDMQCAPEKLD